MRDFMPRRWARGPLRSPSLIVGTAMLLFMAFVAVVGPVIAPYRAHELSFEALLAPSATHVMGTDELGRDAFSRLLSGGLPSLTFGIGAAVISTIVGVILGAIPGYFGGWVDHLFSRFFEVFLTIPGFVLIILLISITQAKDLQFTMLAVGLTLWPQNARIMRSQVLTLRSRGYVESARTFGGSWWYILGYHLIPNAIYPVISNSALLVGAAILTEAGLSFLGLGDPQLVSWGQMVYRGRPFLGSAWWLSFFPGLAIGLLVFAFLYIGDGLNELLEPRRRVAMASSATA